MSFLQKLRNIFYGYNEGRNDKWIAVPGFESGYEMTRRGVIKSKSRRYLNRILPRKINKGGYYYVKLSHDGKESTLLVHRLLALAYVPNPEESIMLIILME